MMQNTNQPPLEEFEKDKHLFQALYDHYIEHPLSHKQGIDDYEFLYTSAPPVWHAEDAEDRITDKDALKMMKTIEKFYNDRFNQLIPQLHIKTDAAKDFGVKNLRLSKALMFASLRRGRSPMGPPFWGRYKWVRLPDDGFICYATLTPIISSFKIVKSIDLKTNKKKFVLNFFYFFLLTMQHEMTHIIVDHIRGGDAQNSAHNHEFHKFLNSFNGLKHYAYDELFFYRYFLYSSEDQSKNALKKIVEGKRKRLFEGFEGDRKEKLENYTNAIVESYLERNNS